MLAASPIEPVKVDDHQVADVEAPVAEHAGALADEIAGAHLADLQVARFARQGKRPKLQEPEVVHRPARSVERGRELDLDRRARPLGADPEQMLQNLGERQQPVLENRREGDEAHAGPRDAVVDGVVLR